MTAICALETFEATVVVGLSRPYAMSARAAEARRMADTMRRTQGTLFQVKDDRSLRYLRSGNASARGVLRDPIPGLLKTLISTGFVVANGH